MMGDQNNHFRNHANAVQYKKTRHMTSDAIYIDHINDPMYKEQTLVKQVKKKQN
jgi:hypothetical protein